MKETGQVSIPKQLAILVLGLLFVLGSSGPLSAKNGPRDIAGSYIALLNLEGLREPPEETLYVILDQNGSAVFVSEHEDDKESTGIGVWQHLPGGKIGFGVASFRFGVASACFLVGPPDANCVLKVGGILERAPGGGLAGAVAVTIESVDGTVVFPLPSFPIVMERLTLGDFPGFP